MNDSPAMLQLLDRFRAGRVACLGDLMLDRYVYGEVDRISAEAPIPIIRAERHDAMLGGVGNVARNIAAAGGRAHLLAVRGEDDAAKEIAKQIKGMAGLTADLARQPDRPTTVKTRYIAAGQQLLRADRETTDPIDAAASEALLGHLAAALARRGRADPAGARRGPRPGGRRRTPPRHQCRSRRRRSPRFHATPTRRPWRRG